MESYRAAYLVVKSKKVIHIGENLIKSCLVEMSDILLKNEVARKLSKIWSYRKRIHIFLASGLQRAKEQYRFYQCNLAFGENHKSK